MGSDLQKAEEFRIAEAMCRNLGKGWKVVAQPAPPLPDILITDGSSEILVELTRYRRDSNENKRYGNDLRFCTRMREEMFADELLRSCSIFFSYRLDNRGVAIVPKPGEIKAVLAELKRIPIEFGGEFIQQELVSELHLELSEESSRLEPTGMATAYAPLYRTNEFPDLSRFFKRVLFRRSHDLEFCASVQTSLHTASVGLCKATLREVVEKKLNKLTSYRAATDLRIWLLIHSDGFPFSTRLPEPHVAPALDLIGTIAKSAEPRFDEIYLLNGSSGSPVIGELYRVPM